MNITIGLLIILVAAFFQGSFIQPMTMARNWRWENMWFSFSLLGMVVLNLALAFIFIPDLLLVYAAVAINDLLMLMLFGICWGIGAVLFGIAMKSLGMALGYPVIMGLIASFGAVIPLVIFHSDEVASLKGIILITGSLVVVTGIALCAKAHVLKEKTGGTKTKKSAAAILVAVAAGILSSLPNVGFSFGGNIIEGAAKAGASAFMAGNAVWALFFSMGFIPNAVYTICLIHKNKSFPLFKKSLVKNTLLGLLMAFMWIGSFYLYGISTIRLGAWGLIIGWPLFISLSIIIGNLWGLANSEWKDASLQAKIKLRQGIAVIFIAVVLIGICNCVP